MRATGSALLSVLLAWGSSVAEASKILALVEDLSVQFTHATFFNSITSRGHEVEFSLADAPDVQIQEFSEWLYDGLIIFAPTLSELSSGVDRKSVV